MQSPDNVELESLDNASKFAFVASFALAAASVGLVWQTALARMIVNGPLSDSEFERWYSIQSNVDNLTKIVSAVFVVLVVSLGSWSYQLHKVVENRVREDRTWSRGWTIGGWLVPVGQFAIPLLVIQESLKILSSESRIRTYATAWWLTSWGAVILNVLNDVATRSMSDIDDYYVTKILMSACLLLTCVSAFAMVQDTRDIAGENLTSDEDSETYEDYEETRISDGQHFRSESMEIDGQNASIADRLRALADLRSQGLITDVEFQRKRNDLLQQL